jgi:hypothetical protein
VRSRASQVATAAALGVVALLACGGKATNEPAGDSGGVSSWADSGDGPEGSSGTGSAGSTGTSSSGGSFSTSSGSGTSPSGGGSVRDSGSSTSSSASGGGTAADGAATACVGTGGSGSSGAGSCAIVDKEVCGATGYEIDCRCPEATCTCTCCGSTVHQVALSTCPACPTAAQAYALCGFPH